MTLTPRDDAADRDPREDVQALIWLLVSQCVIRERRGEFLVRVPTARGERCRLVRLTVRMDE